MPVNGPINENQIAFKAVMPWHEGLRVKNVFAGTLAIGTLVYINGTTTDPTTGVDVYATITKADADATAPANRAVYVVTEAMGQNEYGSVAKYFVHRGVDTSSWTTVGDPAYLSTTAGLTTPTAPSTGASNVQPVGFCVKKSSTAGILVYDLRSFAVPNTFGNSSFTPGFLSADATGRALMAAAYFNVATVDSKFATGSIGEDRLTANELDGRVVGNLSLAAAGALVAANVGIPVVIQMTIPAGATGNVDFTSLPYKIRIYNVQGMKTVAAGGGGGTIQLMNGATTDNITDAISIDVADQTVIRAGTLNDAFYDVAANATLRWVRTRTASTNEACNMFVYAVRIA